MGYKFKETGKLNWERAEVVAAEAGHGADSFKLIGGDPYEASESTLAYGDMTQMHDNYGTPNATPAPDVQDNFFVTDSYTPGDWSKGK